MSAGTLTERGAARDGGGAEVLQQRGLDFVRIRGFLVGRQLAASAQRAQDPRADGAEDPFDVAVCDFAVWMERDAPRAEGTRECTVEPEAVEVDVQPKARIEALREDDGAGVRPREAVPSRAVQVEARDGADEGAADDRAGIGVVGAQQAQAVGQRQDPLTDGNEGQHRVDEVRGEVRHASAAARRAEAAALAREGDQFVPCAAIAVHAAEAVREDAAVEEGGEFLADEQRQRAVAVVVDARQERGQMPLHDLEEHALFGPSPLAAPFDPHAAPVHRWVQR